MKIHASNIFTLFIFTSLQLVLASCDCINANNRNLSRSDSNEPDPDLDRGSDAEPATFMVASLFDFSQPNTLGLNYAPGTATTVAYSGKAGFSQYNHGAVLMPFKGKLYLQWQSSKVDEDAPDTVVRYSSSVDGSTWSEARVLVPARSDAVVTSGGWWTDGNTLVAYINVWPNSLSPRGGFTEYMTSPDGEIWSEPAAVRMADGQPLNGVVEQDVKALPDGRLLTAVHQQPGLIVIPFYTDDPLGVSGWQAGNLPHMDYAGDVSREIEPSWFMQADGDIDMVFRDQAGSYTVLAASSVNRGENWTQAVTTNMPDSRSKQSAGNLPDGTAFLVNNPGGNRDRFPLVVTLSERGEFFDRAFLLAGGDLLPPMRYQGKYKRVGYSYPKSIVWNNSLWVSYALNKEDIAVSRVHLSELSK